ncbi:hypothetical protein DFH09DRAFT_659210 [Mycena vulgaris]|nr:hypothetical protein DFH09DRAFT_659210 [Mycena vulgaris]
MPSRIPYAPIVVARTQPRQEAVGISALTTNAREIIGLMVKTRTRKILRLPKSHETYAFRRVHIRFMYLVNTPMVPGWSRPGMIEDYTPSIHIEPPPDSDEQDLFASLGAFDNFDNYGPTSQSGMNDGYPTVPALFIQGSELPSSGRSDLWSPVSSFSGDVFPDDFSSDDFAPHWSQHSQQFSGYSSPALSPSLSPLTSAFDGFALDERYPAGDQSVLSSGPAIHWLNADPFPNSLGTAMSWGPAQTDMHRNANNNNTMSTPGNLVAGWRYPASDERPPADSHSDRPPPSPSRLTVPVVGLQRRGVGALQRSRAHSDLAALLPDQDTGRGRGQHRTALSIPNSRSVNNGS